MWPFSWIFRRKKKEVGAGSSKQLKNQVISQSLNAANAIRSPAAERLGAIYKEINNVQAELKRARRGLKDNPIAKGRIPTCPFHFSRAKYHVSRIISKLR